MDSVYTSAKVQRGYSLIEAIIVIAIVLVMGRLAMPSFSTVLDNTRATSAANRIIGMVAFSRTSAIEFHQWTTLCPRAPERITSEAESCARNWRFGALSFLDSNRNGRFEPDEGDQLLRVFPEFDTGNIRWRAFRNRSYLQFTSRGVTAFQNGNFQYCPDSGDVRNARQIIINVQGRARLAPDSDGDGVAEDSRGRPLRC